MWPPGARAPGARGQHRRRLAAARRCLPLAIASDLGIAGSVAYGRGFARREPSFISRPSPRPHGLARFRGIALSPGQEGIVSDEQITPDDGIAAPPPGA